MSNTHEFQTIIQSPIDKVWHVLAERFDHIGDWASGIPRSTPAEAALDVGAPVAGRVCDSNMKSFNGVTETIVEYGEDPYFFTYRALGTPKWMGVASNTWHAESVDADTTLVYFEPSLTPAGLLGKIVMPLFMVLGRRMARTTLDDLKVFVETGEPSVGKQKAIAKNS